MEILGDCCISLKIRGYVIEPSALLISFKLFLLIFRVSLLDLPKIKMAH